MCYDIECIIIYASILGGYKCLNIKVNKSLAKDGMERFLETGNSLALAASQPGNKTQTI